MRSGNFAVSFERFAHSHKRRKWLRLNNLHRIPRTRTKSGLTGTTKNALFHSTAQVSIVLHNLLWVNNLRSDTPVDSELR